jgi:type IV fimbrial biogenesis protein FimT
VRSFSRGFTLIELMVVVTIAAVMLGIAVPSFTGFVAGQRVKTAASEFAMAVVFARAEAIKRNADVTITAAASGATGWQDGWTVAAGGTALSTQSAYSGLVFSGPTSAITFKSSGRLSSAVATMTITGQNSNARCIAIDLSGLPKSTQSTGVC